MRDHSTAATARRRGVALVAVLYFLVVCALTSAALLFAQRSASRNTISMSSGAQLLAAAEASVYSTLSEWRPAARIRQPVGSTTTTTGSADGFITGVSVTRLTTRIYSITGEARLNSGNVARRVNLLVRLPTSPLLLHGALVSAVNVTVGPDVRFTVDSAQCAESASAAIILGVNAALVVDTGISPGAQPVSRRDSLADDSSSYLAIGDSWWSDLARRADVHFAADSRIAPKPSVTGGQCVPTDDNWGDPSGVRATCADRSPLVYASGDLTIEGGTGQGVLLVDGHLAITGSFTFSGQIVARRGIETRADNITISGSMYAWRATTDSSVSRATTNDVMLTHATTLRHSDCDARYGIASWLQPRRVRERAWSELF